MKDLIYPFLLRCCRYSEIQFWKSLFENLACGETPYSTYIYKGCLVCSYKDKEFNYFLDKNKDPKLIYDELTQILRDKLNLKSSSEILELKSSIPKQKLNFTSWSEVKTLGLKESLIERFAITMKKEYNLTLNQTTQLINVIFQGLVFKNIDTNDIQMYDGDIFEIQGITFENSKFYCNFNIYESQQPYNQVVICDTKMSSLWEPYINKKYSLRKT
jgi:hypothetical protein